MTAWPLLSSVLAAAWFDRLLAPGPARTMALAMIGVALIIAGIVVIALLIRGRPTPADRALRVVERHSKLDRRSRRAIRELASLDGGPPAVALYLSEHAFQTAVQRAHERGHVVETKPLERACAQLGYSSPSSGHDAAALDEPAAVAGGPPEA